jgi:hypothetical protein
MNKRCSTLLAGLCGLGALLLLTVAASAQMPEVKPKPPMYSYIANWQVPRANWPEIEKTIGTASPSLQKGLSDGTLVGYGSDTALVHTADGATHDTWWSSMSLAGVIKALEQVRAAVPTDSPAFNNSKHWDEVLQATYYNWKPGANFKSAYTLVLEYHLKADAPGDTLENLSSHLIAPVLEKLLADGSIVEYEIDTMALHTEAPGEFDVVIVSPNPEGVDTARAAIVATQKDHPLAIQTFASATESNSHRDYLMRTDGTYK